MYLAAPGLSCRIFRGVCVCVSGCFATPWTVACQASCLWDFPSKNIRVGCYFILKGNNTFCW